MKNSCVFVFGQNIKRKKRRVKKNSLRIVRLAVAGFLYYIDVMESWRLNYRRGLRKLRQHEPGAALRFLRDAIAECPVERAADLADVLFHTGIAMKKIGLHDAAVQSWNASRKLRRGGPARRHLRRFSNEYGLAKQGLAELDDWRAFYSLQVGRYLKSKRSRSIGTLAERDMIRDLIFDAWRELKSATSLDDKTPEQKLALFRGVSIVFPFFYLPGGTAETGGTGGLSRGFGGGSCPCGSGLPYHRCCGRSERPYGAGNEGF